LVKALAVEVAGHGVTVNMACPGRIETPRVIALDELAAQRSGVATDEVRGKSEQQIPAGRYGHVSEFAALVTFLASEQASYITGQTVMVDGGLAATLP
jgi:3-oxoacyl-[acyl-carrier protein] reductase